MDLDFLRLFRNEKNPSFDQRNMVMRINCKFEKISGYISHLEKRMADSVSASKYQSHNRSVTIVAMELLTVLLSIVAELCLNGVTLTST